WGAESPLILLIRTSLGSRQRKELSFMSPGAPGTLHIAPLSYSASVSFIQSVRTVSITHLLG
ncbi:hypothetical protein T265_16070, partial [Opisthorchis viverrini]